MGGACETTETIYENEGSLDYTAKKGNKGDYTGLYDWIANVWQKKKNGSHSQEHIQELKEMKLQWFKRAMTHQRCYPKLHHFVRSMDNQMYQPILKIMM